MCTRIQCVQRVIIQSERNLSTSNLLLAKSRVAPKQLTLPHLEMATVHILSKLTSNVKSTLKEISEVNKRYDWFTSNTVLCWLYKTVAWSIYE